MPRSSLLPPPRFPARISKLIAEARRRRVFRTAGLDIVAAWVLLQVADLAFESASLPDSLLRYIWFAAFAGFPIALVFGWYYEITAGTIAKTTPRVAVFLIAHCSILPRDTETPRISSISARVVGW